MAAYETEQIHDVHDDDNDHDRLTVAASEERLRGEIADVEASLETVDTAHRAAAEGRLTALRAALDRIEERAATSPGESGFLSYTPPHR